MTAHLDVGGADHSSRVAFLCQDEKYPRNDRLCFMPFHVDIEILHQAAVTTTSHLCLGNGEP